jgi:NMD protein affecting ribosome stability and mRNA decay
MGYGKERPCKKCGEVKPIMARGLCSACFTSEKNSGTLDNFPAARPAISRKSKDPQRLIDLLLQELRNIAKANPCVWEEPSDFQGWAQSRARHAISQVEG